MKSTILSRSIRSLISAITSRAISFLRDFVPSEHSMEQPACFGKRAQKRNEAAGVSDSLVRLKDPATSYSPMRRPHSTIGAGGLNFRVRDENGCDSSAIATGN